MKKRKRATAESRGQGRKPGVTIISIGRWGRFPTFQAKIGTGPSAVIIVKRKRDFHAGQCLEFANVHDLEGMCVGCTPKWRGGLVDKIEHDRLYLALM